MGSEGIIVTRDGAQVATATADASGHAVIVVPAAGWGAGARSLGVTARVAGRSRSASPNLPVEIAPRWRDLFAGADGLPGNGWVIGHQLGLVSGGALVINGPAFAFAVDTNPAGGVLQADGALTVGLPHSMAAREWWGIALRVVDGSAVFVLRTSSGFLGFEGLLQPLYSEGAPAGAHMDVTGGVPASWSVDRNHTATLEVVGTQAILYLDDQEYGRFTCSAGAAGGGVALLGDCQNSPWTFLDIAVADR